VSITEPTYYQKFCERCGRETAHTHKMKQHRWHGRRFWKAYESCVPCTTPPPPPPLPPVLLTLDRGAEGALEVCFLKHADGVAAYRLLERHADQELGPPLLVGEEVARGRHRVFGRVEGGSIILSAEPPAGGGEA
jgi:hypothetical protein